ncbi:hypothetical protein Hanom_Chr10g00956711 [Helianthus anomalus]
MPEVQPVRTAGVGDDVSGDVEYLNLERNDCHHNGFNDRESSPIIERNLNIEVRNESFVPAVSYDFDQLIANDNAGPSASKVVKIKKI